MNNLIFSTNTKLKQPSVIYNKFIHEKKNEINNSDTEYSELNGPVYIDRSRLFGGINPENRSISIPQNHPLRVGMFENIKNGKKCKTCGLGAHTIILYNGKQL
jgi:hypothetical protein